MKSIIVLCAVMLVAAPAVAINTNNIYAPFDPDANTLLLMHFDQTAPDLIVTDSSGNGDHGDLLHSQTGAPGDPNWFWQASTVPHAGFANAGYGWSNPPDVMMYLQIEDADESLDFTGMNGSDMTIDFWLGPQGNPGGWILKAQDGGYAVNLEDVGGGANVVNFLWAGFGNILPDTTPLLRTETHHVRIIMDRTTKAGIGKMDITFYINGSLSSTSEHDWYAGHHADNYGIQIYQNGNAPYATAYFSNAWGSIDELRISDVNRGAPIPEPASIGLIGLLLASLIRRKK